MRGSLRALMAFIRSFRVVVEREEARDDRDLDCCCCFVCCWSVGDESMSDSDDDDVDPCCWISVLLLPLLLLGVVEAKEKVDIRSP